MTIKVFILLYIIDVAALFFLFQRGGADGPLLPGDIYIVRGNKRIYLPFLSALLLTIVLIALFSYLKNKI